MYMSADGCNTLPTVNTHNETAVLPLFSSSTDPVIKGLFQLPTDVQLESLSGTLKRRLDICFTTSESGGHVTDFVKLNNTLFVVPEPIANLQADWIVNYVFTLSFNSAMNDEGLLMAPVNDNAGMAGDMIVLMADEVAVTDDCANAYLQNQAASFPLTNGVKAELQADGIAREYAIAQGKINELPAGKYKVCFATKASEGDAQADFKMLSTSITLKRPPATGPVLHVPETVGMGNDIISQWEASRNGLDQMVSTPGSWVGLYKKNECTAYGVNIHRCHLAVREVLPHTSTGSVAFHRSDYKEPGEYELRYFKGDTRHGQGVVCRGIKNIVETYLQCTLEATTVSKVIYVDPDEPSLDEGNIMPGLEATFDEGKESYEIPGHKGYPVN